MTKTTLVPGVGWPAIKPPTPQQKLAKRLRATRVPKQGPTYQVMMYLADKSNLSETDIAKALGIDPRCLPKMAYRGHLTRVKAPSKHSTKPVWYYSIKDKAS